MKGEFTQVAHEFGPIFNEKSEILILGSFPSVKSREQQFYYGHPQNRFWRVVAAVFGEAVPSTIPDKKEFLLRNHIALWDVIDSCEIIGSSDSSIRNVKPNDMERILDRAPIRAIYANGDKAYQLFLKYCRAPGQPDLYRLPSTSPANAAWKMEGLLTEWQQMKYGTNEKRTERGTEYET